MQELGSGLNALINQHAAGEDPMSFHNIHGFLTALVICPAGIERPGMIEIILDGKPNASESAMQQLGSYLTEIEDSIDRAFNSEDGFSLSCESELDHPDDESLEDWCTGFMEGHFLAEDRWFEQNEQEVCELLLPLMLASGLFSDEPEFREILKDQQLTEDMYSQIPEVLMELYLLFQSPEDTNNQEKTRKK